VPRPTSDRRRQSCGARRSAFLISVKTCLHLTLILLLTAPLFAEAAAHDINFWRSIRVHDFALPPGESVDHLALEIVDLAAETDPALRDECGYEILAAWVYRKNLLTGDQLEAVRRKLIPGMSFHIGESDNPTIFRRSFSALYLSILAAEDLRKPFLSEPAFHETLNTALKCYSTEKDLRGYTPENGWAHATAHVADLLKFLARNPRLTKADQRRIVDAVAQRCRSVSSVFVWGEDARIAAALFSVVERKDFDPAIFDSWFKIVSEENSKLWKTATLDIGAYVRVRTQANVLAQFAAKVGSKTAADLPASFREAVNKIAAELN
jgi:hypothetical protein